MNRYYEQMAMNDRNRLGVVSLNDLAVGLQDLRVAIRNGTITDAREICAAANKVNAALQSWSDTLSQFQTYEVVTIKAERQDEDEVYGLDRRDLHFQGQRHVYRGEWMCAAWTFWRSQRILTNQIIFHHAAQSEGDQERAEAAVAIRSASTEICISSSSFVLSPRKSDCRPASTNRSSGLMIFCRLRQLHLASCRGRGRALELLGRERMGGQAASPYWDGSRSAASHRPRL
jgi:hypothetical protein